VAWLARRSRIPAAGGVAYLHVGDGDAAAMEMERHLRSLLYMGRLAQATVSER
jgi:hypothetical protein